MLPSLRAAAAAALLLPGLVHGLYINGSVIAPCDSVLYCQGEILKAIELASPFQDSKTYVDM
jgi:alpha,alpha-trehalase